MARYGINPAGTLGISMPLLRSLARQLGKNHGLALELWQTGIHEARILACLIDRPTEVTRGQMNHWAGEFDSWDVCDQCCGNLFDKTPWAREKALRWSRSPRPFVKRAGFVLMAQLAVHNKSAPDSFYLAFFARIEAAASDDRNFVKKAINWALRQIGKRNLALNRAALDLAETLRRRGAPSARWIGTDALRELSNPLLQERLRRTAAPPLQSHQPVPGERRPRRPQKPRE
jgi:3-methyladenine DNA glycosylase AlkD